MRLEQMITQQDDGPGEAAGGRWAERQLTPAERGALRGCYPARKGPDLVYLAGAAGFVLAFTAAWYVVLRPAVALYAAGFAVVGLLIVAFYNPKRLRRALRSRRA